MQFCRNEMLHGYTKTSDKSTLCAHLRMLQQEAGEQGNLASTLPILNFRLG